MNERKKINIYTDLALEAAELVQGDANGGISGINMTVDETEIGESGDTLKITWIEILDENGASELGRPVGNYVTLESHAMKTNDTDAHETIIKVAADFLGRMKAFKDARDVLVVGLGNQNVTPDALGPRVVSRTLVTRHIKSEIPPAIRDGVASVSAVSPGVMGITGIETGEIVKGIIDRTHPEMAVIIDALAARRTSRVNTTIQMCDTGLSPGSGMGSARKPLTPETMGIPVIAIGVPTVVDAATLVNDTMDLMLDEISDALPEGSGFFDMLKSLETDEKHELIKRALDPDESGTGNMFVTPKDVDVAIDRLANIIANALNIALHPGITKEDINKYMD